LRYGEEVQLTLHSDYALRGLIYLGTHPGEHGYVKLLPGRSGGMGPAWAPELIRLGDVVVDAEQNMRLVECFDMSTHSCPITKHCGLKGARSEALDAFVASLITRTLADRLHGERRKALKSTFVRLQR